MICLLKHLLLGPEARFVDVAPRPSSNCDTVNSRQMSGSSPVMLAEGGWFPGVSFNERSLRKHPNTETKNGVTDWRQNARVVHSGTALYMHDCQAAPPPGICLVSENIPSAPASKHRASVMMNSLQYTSHGSDHQLSRKVTEI